MPADRSTIREYALDHGLDLVAESIMINELGLDFQLAIGEAVDGRSWVLRIPRARTSPPAPPSRGVS
ncbi:hypothetical protein [Brevibacterium oceani]|uniref:hypothetical protein n=1 Tax=Brevibacterium oceani TaxID=358099 RepID=UPI002159ED58|nr:hypothetical protein [Brevibacterium oceani]